MLATALPQLGFDTIGNATLICYDQAPLLAADPWITDQAYFGSCGHSHVIPHEQLNACLRCPNVFFSHGPQHLLAPAQMRLTVARAGVKELVGRFRRYDLPP